MTLKLYNSYVQPPSAAPTTSATGGIYQVAHRRVNTSRYYSSISPVVTSVAFPTTLTPQSYADTDNLLRDEFLVSADSGATWKLIPRASGTGAQTVAAYDSSWAAASTVTNQDVSLTSIDLGNFSSSSSPNKLFVLANTPEAGESVDSLTFNLIDPLDSSVADQYSGLVQFELLGTAVLQAANGTLTTTSNTSFLWLNPAKGFNTVAIKLPLGAFVKLRVTLVNFAAGGLLSNTVNFGLEVLANKRRYELGSLDSWLTSAIWINPELALETEFVSAGSTTGKVTLKRLAVNYNGVVYVNAVDKELTAAADGTYRVFINSLGNFGIELTSATLAAGALEVAQFTVTSGSYVYGSLRYRVSVRNNYLGLAAGAAVSFGRFLTVSTTGTVSHSTATSTVAGVSLKAALSGAQVPMATGNLVVLELGGSVTAGDKLAPDANGAAVLSTGGFEAIALQSGISGQTVLAVLV